MSDAVVGIRINADGSVARGEVKATREELDKLGTSNSKLASQYSGLSDMFSKNQASIKRNSDEYKNLDNQLVSLLSHINPVYAGIYKFQQGQDLLDRGLSAGLLTHKKYDEALLKLTQTYTVATESGHKFEASSSQITNSVRALFDELSSGRDRQATGTFARLITQTTGLGIVALGVAAAIVAIPVAMVAAAVAGEKETERINNALKLTSNYAGQTNSSILNLAQSVSAAGTITIGTAKDIVTQLVNSGRIGADSIGLIAKLAGDYANATGQDVSKITPQLIKLFEDPAKGAIELNKQMHYLSTTDQEYIDHLVRIGQEEQARVFSAQKLLEHLPKESEQLGFLGRAWDDVKKAASSAWDAMLGLGRADNIDQRIAEIQQKLNATSRGGQFIIPREAGHVQQTRAGPVYIQSEFEKQQALLVSLQGQKIQADGIAKSESAAADQRERSAKAVEEINKSETYQISILKDRLELVKTHTPENAAEATNQARRILEINRQIRDLQNGLAKDPRQQAIDSALAQYKNAQADAAKSSDKFLFENQNQVLDNQLKLSLVSYVDYFKQKQTIEDDYYNKQATRIQSRITIEKNLAAQYRSHGDTAGALGKDAEAEKLKSELDGLTQAHQNSSQKLLQEATADNKKLGDQIIDMQIQVANASGKYGEAAVLSAHKKYDDLIKEFTVNGKTAAVQRANELIDVDMVQGNIKEIETAYDRMLTNLDDELKRVDIEKNAGLLTEYEARQKILAISSQQLAIRENELAAEKEAQNKATTPVAKADAEIKIQLLELEISKLQGIVSETNRTFEYGARSAVDTYFDTISNRATQARDVIDSSFKSAQNTLSNFFKTGKLDMASFFDLLQTKLADLAAQQVLEGVIGNSSGGGLGSIIAGFFGRGTVGGAATGGINFNAVTPGGPGISLASANGNAFSASGLSRFANGGAFGDGQILTRPTYFKFASGGSFANGVAGEAGPEGALPLKRLANGKLGVFADIPASGTGQVNQVSITVNADGSGRQQSGNASDANLLAQQLEGAVLQVLVKQKRPGGLLTS